MSPEAPTIQPPRSQTAELAVHRESGLARQLSSRQLAMIAIGGAIGTGLFLGSSLAVHAAGPAVILTYAGGAIIALLLMGALSEMAAAHPTAGSFGLYAEMYVSGWAGFVVRYTYWAVQCIAIGGEATAVAIYCKFWFPSVPGWIWIVGFSLGLVVVNGASVGSFGEFEYWFSTVKVSAIVVFIILGIALLAGVVPSHTKGLSNLTSEGGFFPSGLKGAWIAMVYVIFSYIGTEVVAVTAGEAKDPASAVPRAMRTMVGRLIVFYLGAVIVLVSIVPWRQIQPGSDVRASPFVTVFTVIGIPAAAHVINFVVLTAALSSMNCNLYLVTRMMFSLSRGGYAPARFGKLTPRGTPLNALLISTAGLFVATTVALRYRDKAFVYLFGVSLFGGLLVWLMIFLTHLFFRLRYRPPAGAMTRIRMPGYPYTSILGLLSIAAILATTWWVKDMHIALVAGLPWLVFITCAYYLTRLSTGNKKRSPDAEND